ncbi:hypothetical protein [Metabacillus litoralis]|uniref:hypothetical protein n=1 Tax=Metabacillus litoralis TaxID=152268 RepID=UPI001CFE68D5|nr:hypothetical protein [Metabacillus litoralis]
MFINEYALKKIYELQSNYLNEQISIKIRDEASKIPSNDDPNMKKGKNSHKK